MASKETRLKSLMKDAMSNGVYHAEWCVNKLNKQSEYNKIIYRFN